ncbi:YXWGXW repeat-containing protein [Janthinobacterium agaricidamnosum]|uniref:YXWGXW repeat-containing protein n=1 Tax=Janthinobacterium agaricidamnosum NBRC 102515 = DSM 9628 TaxID=1349767 RepID=W0V633_9BURK|nr:YXWGXW repeat-containing protein [Janthinobacterium agaricidamnosum]CDG82727.1 putative uncharacterized protein [Janthinobacterium agaricidamnosum NBRC 102515 = DSM 9628]
MKTFLLCGAAAIVLGSAALMPTQAMAQAGLSIVINTAPPPPRYEVMPAPRRGYEWAPGYWNWNGHRHVWMAGHWERLHPGQHYARPEWQQTHGGWRFNRGGWQADPRPGPPPGMGRGNHGPRGDRDHDGVPNRYDDHPNNPNRR